MTTTPNFRELCAELLDELQYQTSYETNVELQDRARAALAAPPPEPPTKGARLVERVARAIHTRVATVEVELWKPEARAASFEVAEWLREQGWKEAAIMIEREAGQ